MFKTAGKDTRPLLTDKTSKLSSKAGSVKRRSAPVRSYQRGLNDAPPVDKVFIYCAGSKIMAGWYEVKTSAVV